VVWRSLDVDHHVEVEPAERGKHDTNNEEVCRDGKSGEVWRRRSSRSTAAGKSGTEGLNDFLTPAASWIKPFMATMH
jgi:hypothetical protein